MTRTQRSRDRRQESTQLILCAGCHEPIQEDEKAQLAAGGTLVHRRCGGKQVSIREYGP